MEPLQAFVLTDANKIELISLTRHCILHATQALQPSVSLSTVLPKSGTHKLESFCSELRDAILSRPGKKRGSTSNILTDEPLLETLDMHKFCDGAISPAEFTMLIEQSLVSRSKDCGLDLEKLHKTCWNYYEVEKMSQISHPKWLSPTCTYRLWLIFNCVLEPELKSMMSTKSLNEVIRRVVELCGFKWNDSDKYEGYGTVDYPLYLDVIVRNFEKFHLETLLTCEVIADMVDEIIHGVLKKGYLSKKGHKRKSWKRRWFILQRTTMTYYENRDNLNLKGKFILNSNTEVRSLPDRGKRKCLFEVTCGRTGTPFMITADDQRMKQEWMLAIKKAIALAKILDGSSKQDDFTDSLAGFYLLKYGTPKPSLVRQDSTVRKMKYHATMPNQRKRLSGKKNSTEEILLASRSSLEDSQEYPPMSPQDEYMPMAPGLNDLISSDDSSGGEDEMYMPMKPVLEDHNFDESYENTEINASMSLPPRSPAFESMLQPHSASFSGSFGLNRPPPVKSRTFTHCVSDKLQTTTILEPTLEKDEEQNEIEVSYEDANIKAVNYKLGFPKDKPLGSYVELGKDGKWKDVVETNLDYDDPPDEKETVDNFLNRPGSMSPGNTSPVNEIERSLPLYLTLLQDPNTVNEDMMSPTSPNEQLSPTSPSHRPVIPPHRRSLPPDSITPPPVSPRHASIGIKPVQNGQSMESPPTPPPRVLSPMHSSSPALGGVPLPFPKAQRTFHATSDPEQRHPTSPTDSLTSSQRLRSSSDFDFDPVVPPPLPPR